MRRYLFLASLCAMPAMAQRVATLDECVAYAQQHNTQVMQSGLSVEDARLQLHTSRCSRLPDLGASLGQSFSFGRGQGRDGTTVDVSSTSASFGISTSVPLFTGFRIPNEIRAARESLRAAEQNQENQKRRLAIQITGYYMQVLYYQGVMQVNAEKVSLDSLNLVTVRTLVEHGRKAENEVYTAEAQLATSRMQLSQSQGNYRLALLDLVQAMNWEHGAIDVAQVDEAGDERLAALYIDGSEWIEVGVATHPSVKMAEHSLKASQYSWRIAKSNFYPQLNFGAGYSNGYFYQYNNPNESFGRQLKLNGSESISLSLSIPIFSRFATRNSVRRAKLNITNQTLQLDETRRQLRKEMEQAQVEAINARDRLRTALAAVKAGEVAYAAERDKYASGTSTLLALQQAQQQLVDARNEVVQARCTLSLRLRMMQYMTQLP